MSDKPPNEPPADDDRRAFLKRMAAAGFAAPLITALGPAASAMAQDKTTARVLGSTTPAAAQDQTQTTTPAPIICACTPFSCIQSNFNGQAIHAGDYVWFSAVLKVQGLSNTEPMTIRFAGQSIAIAPGITIYPEDAIVTFSPSATSATTTCSGGTWVTTVPSHSSGNAFLSGVAFLVPSGVDISESKPTWCGTFCLPTTSVMVQWQWAAAQYGSCFSGTSCVADVKATDDNHYPPYKNSDHAGTPEDFKGCLLPGATGGGGSNYTGSLSATVSASC